MAELSEENIERRAPPETKPECCCESAPRTCCSSATSSTEERIDHPDPAHERWCTGTVKLSIGEIPRASTVLTLADRFGSWKARWGIRRMRYLVRPGLYAVGSPTPESLVLVSANYKMSFDHLRAQLGGRHFWILVLDTRGVNVWCAAGKGTFGTDEIVRRIDEVGLKEIVSHRKLVVPQLGATGIKAYEVKKRSGFRVVYGPVRARDLPDFLDAGLKATREMRQVRFPLWDRLVLIPLELRMSAWKAFLIAAGLVILSGLGPDGYSLERMKTLGFWNAMFFTGAWLSGLVLTPLLLPWLPGRSFSVKGAWAGMLYMLGTGWLIFSNAGPMSNWVLVASWLLIVPAMTSFLGMNYTGASTYTSLSGVLKEMRVAIPLQKILALVGLALWITGLFV